MKKLEYFFYTKLKRWRINFDGSFCIELSSVIYIHLKFHNDRRDGRKREWEWFFSGCVPREPFFCSFFCLTLYFAEPLYSFFTRSIVWLVCVFWTKKRYLWKAPHFYIPIWWFDIQYLVLRWTVDEKKELKKVFSEYNGTRSTLCYSICLLSFQDGYL